MFSKRVLVSSAVLLLALTAAPAGAGFRLGIGLTFPIGGPYYYPAPYPYYYPAVYPAPVIVQAPTVYQPAYTAPAAPAPAPAPATLPAPTPLPAAAPATQPLTRVSGHEDEIDVCLRDLINGADAARAAAAVQLGRLHAVKAIGALAQALAEDRCSAVREAAARGLGLIASPSTLEVLQRAAQSDDDRDVRHSASFAADVIRSHLSGR
jgi:hypothetical protein